MVSPKGLINVQAKQDCANLLAWQADGGIEGGEEEEVGPPAAGEWKKKIQAASAGACLRRKHQQETRRAERLSGGAAADGTALIGRGSGSRFQLILQKDFKISEAVMSSTS